MNGKLAGSLAKSSQLLPTRFVSLLSLLAAVRILCQITRTSPHRLCNATAPSVADRSPCGSSQNKTSASSCDCRRNERILDELSSARGLYPDRSSPQSNQHAHEQSDPHFDLLIPEKSINVLSSLLRIGQTSPLNISPGGPPRTNDSIVIIDAHPALPRLTCNPNVSIIRQQNLQARQFCSATPSNQPTTRHVFQPSPERLWRRAAGT